MGSVAQEPPPCWDLSQACVGQLGCPEQETLTVTQGHLLTALLGALPTAEPFVLPEQGFTMSSHAPAPKPRGRTERDRWLLAQQRVFLTGEGELNSEPGLPRASLGAALSQEEPLQRAPGEGARLAMGHAHPSPAVWTPQLSPAAPCCSQTRSGTCPAATTSDRHQSTPDPPHCTGEQEEEQFALLPEIQEMRTMSSDFSPLRFSPGEYVSHHYRTGEAIFASCYSQLFIFNIFRLPGSEMQIILHLAQP